MKHSRAIPSRLNMGAHPHAPRFGSKSVSLGLVSALLFNTLIGCSSNDATDRGSKPVTPPDTTTDAGPAPEGDAATDAGPVEGGPVVPSVPSGVLPGPSRGSAIALSPDDSVAMVVKRDVGSVSVFSIKYGADGAAPVASKTKELSLGAGS